MDILDAPEKGKGWGIITWGVGEGLHNLKYGQGEGGVRPRSRRRPTQAVGGRPLRRSVARDRRHLLGHRRCARHARRHRALGPARRAHLASASLHCREPFYRPRLAARGRNPMNAAAPRCHTAGEASVPDIAYAFIGEGSL